MAGSMPISLHSQVFPKIVGIDMSYLQNMNNSVFVVNVKISTLAKVKYLIAILAISSESNVFSFFFVIRYAT